ncbi:MAG: serine/threonine-protein kinase [Sandaracinaceae bacterium]
MGHIDPSVGGAAPQDAQAPRVIPFGKYLLLDRIAVGGMAEVYTAKSFGIEGFEKIIAIKRILPTMAEDNDFISMFIDEAKIAGHLTHANVVPIYELGKIGDSHYIAMEYVWGKDLLQIMNRFRRMRRHMPPVMAAWIASKVLEGLDYAHRKRDRHGRPMGIIHRDVSPQNVLVSYEGQIKLIDFGIAKAASRNTKTQAGVLKGKFGYMSPEQVRGLPIDHRSDVFAASTCLHEMLTGERLFVGESDFSTLEKVRNADVAPPSTLVADIPKDLEDIVLRGLAREPEDRWQTAGEMQEELQRFIALQRPPFGTSKLNTWMRTAFAPELAKEKARLDSFSKVNHPGGAMPAPKVPAPPTPPPMPGRALDDFDEDDLQGEATMISASPFDEMEAAREAAAASAARGPASSADELPEEPTQIFFSAEDMEEILDEPSRPMNGHAPPFAQAPGGAPPPAALPPMRAGETPRTMPMPVVSLPGNAPVGGAPVAASPTPAPVADMFAPPPSNQRRMETVEVDRVQATSPPPAASSSGGMGRWIAILAVAAVLVIGLSVGGALLFFGSDSTGTVSVRVSPELEDARVFVDGVARGRAPLLLEHVPEGDHQIEVRADGYRTAQRAVPVTAGSMAMLEVAMEHEIAVAAPPSVAAAPPVAAVVPAPPAVVAGTPVAPVAGTTDAVAALVPAPPPAELPPPPSATPPPTAPANPPAEAAHEGRSSGSGSGSGSSSSRHETTRPSPRHEDPPPSRSVRTRQDDDPPPSRPVRVPRTEEEPTPSSGGGGAGTLTINTMPWARVFVDGRDTGRNTPVRNLRVPAGHHRIGLRTNDGTMHTIETDVSSGQNVRIVRQL